MTTALDRVYELSDLITDIAAAKSIDLPSYRILQAGSTVQGQCGVYVSALGVSPLIDFNQINMPTCAPQMLCTIAGAIVRDAVTTDQHGVDLPGPMLAASEWMVADSDLLWEAAWSTDTVGGPVQVSIEYNLTGLVSIVSVQYTTGMLVG